MDLPGDVSTQAVLPLSSAYTQGTFERSGDADWFRVVLKKGVHYAVELDCGFGACSLRILDRQRGKMRYSVGSENRGIELTAPYDGVFFVESLGYDTRPYKIRMAKDCADSRLSSCALNADRTGGGNLFSAKDRDWLAVAMVAGTTYDIEVRSTDTEMAFFVGLSTKFGGVIPIWQYGAGGGYMRIDNLTPRKTDHYFVTVEARYSSGPYQVTVIQRR